MAGGISIALAIAVGLISSFIQSIGLTVQRKSHVEEDLLPSTLRRKPIHRPLWLTGFAIYITSNVFSTIFQLDALPIVILAPLGAVSLIFNALLARLVLGDSFGASSIVGTGLVAIGAVLIAVFGVVPEEEHTLDELLALWGRSSFLAFFSVLSAAVFSVLGLAHLAVLHVQQQVGCGRSQIRGTSESASSPSPTLRAAVPSTIHRPMRSDGPASSQSSPAVRASALAGRCCGSSPPQASATSPLVPQKVRSSQSSALMSPSDVEGSEFTMLSAPDQRQQHRLTMAGLAFAAASGTLSGLSLVLAKAAVELLVITIDHYRTGRGSNQFVRIESWFLVMGLAVGAILQLAYLNYSLTFASPALICPLAFCFFNLSSIFDGLVFYNQIGQLRLHQIALVTLGVTLLLIGVWVVSLIRPANPDGVDMGTWVEEEDHEQLGGLELSRTSSTSDAGNTVCEPSDRDPQHEGFNRRSRDHECTSGDHTSPRCVSAAKTTPMSPLSPTRRRSHPLHYGSRMPEQAQTAQPTGFSIGLGAASPGFALIPEHYGHVSQRRKSTIRSESQAIYADTGTTAERSGTCSSTNVSEPVHSSHPETSSSQGDILLSNAPQGREISAREHWWRRLIRGRGEGRIRLELGESAHRQ